MVLLQLCCWKFSHKVTLYQNLFDWNWILFIKMTNSLFEPPFRGVMGDVCTSSIARWKACGWLPICNNLTFFASSYSLDVISSIGRNQHFSKGVALSANFRWQRTSATNLWKQEYPFICNIKIAAVCFFVSSQCRCVTDRQNYDPQDRTSIAASRFNKNDEIFLGLRNFDQKIFICEKEMVHEGNIIVLF